MLLRGYSIRKNSYRASPTHSWGAVLGILSHSVSWVRDFLHFSIKGISASGVHPRDSLSLILAAATTGGVHSVVRSVNKTRVSVSRSRCGFLLMRDSLRPPLSPGVCVGRIPTADLYH